MNTWEDTGIWQMVKSVQHKELLLTKKSFQCKVYSLKKMRKDFKLEVQAVQEEKNRWIILKRSQVHEQEDRCKLKQQ